MKGVAKAVQVGLKSSKPSAPSQRAESIVNGRDLRVEVDYLYMREGRPVD